MAGGNRKNQSSTKKPGSRKSPHNPPSRFVQGGLLSDWPNRSPSGKKDPPYDKSMTRKNTSDTLESCGSTIKVRGRNSIRYDYPLPNIQGVPTIPIMPQTNRDVMFKEANPAAVIGSHNTACNGTTYMTPLKHSVESSYSCSYTSSADDANHRGLGFCDDTTLRPVELPIRTSEGQESSSSEKERNACEGYASIEETSPDEIMSPPQSSGFLSIGGMRLYTQDITDQEVCSDDEDSTDAESSDSLLEDDESEHTSDETSDIDDEIVQDYIKGIGGIHGLGEILNVQNNLVTKHTFPDGHCSSKSRLDDTIKKFGGISLLEASREYGMRKPVQKKNFSGGTFKSGGCQVSDRLNSDDLILVKDPRSHFPKKKHPAASSKSSLLDFSRRDAYRRFPGEKKKHRKEAIAIKRRERMIKRGVDLEQINSKLEHMVMNQVDLLSFHPMHPRDCRQVQRLASVYHLHSSCQGSGKKRFVTVARTEWTRLPTLREKLHLETLIGPCIEDDLLVSKGCTKQNKKVVKNKGGAGDHGLKARKEKNLGAKHGSSLAKQPMSFISSGILQPEVVERMSNEVEETLRVSSNNAGGASSSFGAFEVHTRGFGSKMMAKMGFVGGGLGKDGQGMAEPIEVIKRPKSLGLGVDFTELSSADTGKVRNRSEPIDGTKYPRSVKPLSKNSSDGGHKASPKIGAFELHTKGFGSKMMAKMGYVEGTGLGRDLQGIAMPIVALKRPKARGLGAKA
uniref:Protein SQS1 n=1 Tax=Kalanchoe fedtschenkoi TaxID=63787 RepID=A0A7N0TT31_KALFE